MSDAEPLDLYSIALLLNYERASTEPRFRYAKLREAALNNAPLETVLIVQEIWKDDSRHRTAFVFDRQKNHSDYIMDMNGPRDTPDNMLPETLKDGDKLKQLTSRQLETIFWQSRAHDGCYKCVALLQHFFDLYPPSTPMIVREGNGRTYTTRIDTRNILEFKLVEPKFTSLSMILPENTTHISGEDDTMDHAVMGFAEGTDGNVATVLDMSSMQFGDVGRGPGAKGRGTFALDTMDEFYDRLEMVTHGTDDQFTKTSARITPGKDDVWLKKVARRAKERWENRGKEKWCEHCGGPVPSTARCSACKSVWYCSAEHQKAAWPFHKHYCVKK